MYFYIYEYIYILPFQTKNGKQKPRRFSLIRLTFAYHANGSYPFANRLNGFNGLNGLNGVNGLNGSIHLQSKKCINNVLIYLQKICINLKFLGTNVVINL